MMTVSTNFGTEAELKAAVIAAGRTPVEDETPVVETPVPSPKEPSAPPAKPGEETPVAAAGSEATPPADKGEKKPQEPSQAASPEPKPTQGFKSKAEKAQALVDRLQQDLELERGGKTKLQAQLAAAEAELARLKPPESAVPATPPGPVKPKRPTRAECEFDDDKYEAAMDKYESSMTEYSATMTAKAIQDAMASRDAEAQQKQQEKSRVEFQNSFVERRDAGSAAISDWQLVQNALDDAGLVVELPSNGVTEATIMHAKNPAELIHFFSKDVLDNESAELNRITALDPVTQVYEITLLEQRLVAERKGKAAPPVAPPPEVAPVKPPEKVPAKTKPPAVVPEPIETVGSHSAGGATRTLTELAERAAAGDAEARKEYFRRRAAKEQ